MCLDQLTCSAYQLNVAELCSLTQVSILLQQLGDQQLDHASKSRYGRFFVNQDNNSLLGKQSWIPL